MRLSHAEWKELRESYAVLDHGGLQLQGAVCLAMLGYFTRADVELLREVDAEDLADRIENILPPEPDDDAT